MPPGTDKVHKARKGRSLGQSRGADEVETWLPCGQREVGTTFLQGSPREKPRSYPGCVLVSTRWERRSGKLAFLQDSPREKPQVRIQVASWSARRGTAISNDV